jgi:gamma-glutamyltranspeptidase/glutathione hydrolase
MAVEIAVLGPHGLRSEANRPVTMGRRGLVCSGHQAASLAGINVLQRGGDAVDAAVAVAAALNVAEPNMSGVGGDGFIMLYRHASRRVEVVNATGPAPALATRESYLPDGIPLKGIRSVSVPGLVDGWLEAHRRYGRLALHTVLEPAIDLAENGLPVSYRLAAALAEARSLGTFATSQAIFWPGGRPLRPGELLVQRDLARTLRGLAEYGRDYFYAGPVARAIDATSREHGGALRYEDLAAFRARWQEPIWTTYRGRLVFETPPNSSGHVLLQELNLVEGFDLAAMGWQSAEAIHLMVEVKKLAFADRERYLGDPDFVDVPLDGLLSKEYATERRRLIDPQRAAPPGSVSAGDPWRYQGRSQLARPRSPRAAARAAVEETTCFVVVDGEGNAVCQLQSLQQSFGSELVAGDTGVLLNNRMTYWHLEPDHPDCLLPGKRVRHTMNTVMVFDAPPSGQDGPGPLLLVLGTPGADTQVQTNLQLVSAILDFGLNPVEAVEAPRWRHLQNPTESTVPHTCEDALILESRLPPTVRDALAAKGHPVQVIGPWAAVGSAMVIRHDPVTGVLHGGADPRRDGYALGW